MSITESLSNTESATEDGIRVEKGIEPGDNAMTVHYRITSERADAAAIRLEEHLGSGFPVGTLDLDAPGHGDWLLDPDGSGLALFDILEAGERVTTGYVVNCSDPDRVKPVFEAPTIDMVDPVESPSDESVDDAGSAGTDGSQQVVTPEAVADALSPAVVAEAISPTLVIDALVAALESDAVDDHHVERLRDSLGDELATGDGGDHAERLDEVDFRLDRFYDCIERLDSTVERVDERTKKMARLVRDADEAVKTERKRLNDVENRLDESLTELSEQVEELEDELSETEEWREQLGEAFKLDGDA
ncbi:hypothetical protein [Haloarchaeobius sp. HRN-SO-5]|uniref:hypothetical protein n=1 Tax=Haloarchaeobius sp. HRN-SO-5 TaxID=3446118 RepID=UPI003EBC1008